MDESTANPPSPQSSLDEYRYEDEYEYAHKDDDAVIAENGRKYRLARIDINKPMADIVRDCFLHRLPARSLFRLRKYRLARIDKNKPMADIVRDCILHRLPARSLFRLRTVNTSWSCLISSPIFAHTQSHTYRSISGVFCSAIFGPTAYAPFPPATAHALPNPSLSFLPDSPVEVLSSSSGLLLCFCHSSRNFFVCNPAHGSWTPVPKPPHDPGLNPAAVLLFLPDVYSFRNDLHIVIPFQIDGVPKGILGFQIFSSSSCGWWVSREVCAVEYLHPKSGVSAGGAAFWRTSMHTVVRYELAGDRVGVVPWPMGHVAGVRWAIGVVGGGRLYCTAVTKEAIQVHKLLDESDAWEQVECFDMPSDWDSKWNESRGGEENTEWNIDADENVVLKKRPLPLRFQGGEVEILLWFKGKVVGVNLSTKRVRVAAAGISNLRGFIPIMCVPYVSTLAAVPPLAATEKWTSSAIDDSEWPHF